MSFKYKRQTVPVAWIVVADRGRARIFSANLPDVDGFAEVASMVHPGSQMPGHDIETDGPGRFQDINGTHHAGQPETDHKHHTAAEFAGQLVDHLEKGRLSNRFGHLVVVAPPLMLGVLRGKMPGPLLQLVIGEMDKDYTHLPEKDIHAHLRNANVFE